MPKTKVSTFAQSHAIYHDIETAFCFLNNNPLYVTFSIREKKSIIIVIMTDHPVSQIFRLTLPKHLANAVL